MIFVGILVLGFIYGLIRGFKHGYKKEKEKSVDNIWNGLQLKFSLQNQKSMFLGLNLL